MRGLIAVGLVLLLILQVRLWAGDDSLAAMWDLERSMESQAHENALLRDRNEQLFAEVQDLRTGVEAIEARARRELGMIGPGETFVLVIDETGPADAAAH